MYLKLVEPPPRLYDINNFLDGSVIYQGTPGKKFCSLISNLSSKPVYIPEFQTVVRLGEHPVTLMVTTITHSELLGVVETKNSLQQTKPVHARHQFD